MPHRTWKHECKTFECECIQGLPVCTYCGVEGEYDGWGLTRIEAMGRYVGQTGLKPMGPHRTYAAERLHGSTTPCEVCEGRGVLDVNSGESFLTCDTCSGTGRLLLWTRDAFNAVRAEILEQFPDAANPGCPWVIEENA